MCPRLGSIAGLQSLLVTHTPACKFASMQRPKAATCMHGCALPSSAHNDALAWHLMGQSHSKLLERSKA